MTTETERKQSENIGKTGTLAGHPVKILNIYGGVERWVALIEVLDDSDILGANRAAFGKTSARTGLVPLMLIENLGEQQ